VDSLFFAWAATAQIGGSPLVPQSIICKVIGTFICLNVAALFTFALSGVIDFVLSHYRNLAFNSAISEQINYTTFEEIDTNKDGKISNEEFLLFMIKKCELVDEEHINKINQKYIELIEQNDKDGDGNLNVSEIVSEKQKLINILNILLKWKKVYEHDPITTIVRCQQINQIEIT